jgi:hypothetical protein
MKAVKKVLALPLSPVEKIILLDYIFAGALSDEGACLKHGDVARAAGIVLKSAVTHCHALQAQGLLVATGERRGLVRAFRVALP